MGKGNEAVRQRRRARRRRAAAFAYHARNNTVDRSAVAFDVSDKEDDNQDDNQSDSQDDSQDDSQETNRRHRRSSVIGDNERVVLDMDPAVSSLVTGASQMLGLVEQDGAAMALAAATATNPLDSLNLLAASAAIANVRLEHVGGDAAQAVTEAAHMARQDLQRLEDRIAHIELELKVNVMNERLALLERLVVRLVSILRNATIDTTQVEDMIQNLNIS